MSNINTEEPLVITEDLSKVFGDFVALHPLNVKVFAGEFFGVFGPNGAGKTTTFNLAIGQLSADSGRIVLDDRLVTDLSMTYRARLGIGYLPQEASVFRSLTVSQNLDIAHSQAFSNPAHRRIRREKLINEFNFQ